MDLKNDKETTILYRRRVAFFVYFYFQVGNGQRN